MGGMLRYGIPQYRLPKEVLDSEIKIIEKQEFAFAIMLNSVRISLLKILKA